ncbi:MAG TPA: helix-turn-helix domain-containing protein [Verrucomicrobiae bacterium]|nr:helix-turn-helix domain-containing protein [Verrucomicrobiae bacterium]
MPKTPDPPTYDFSFLRDLRKRDGLTIHAVSERSGISPAVISKLERNQTSAELETLFRLSRVFGMNATEMLYLAEQRTAQRAFETSHVGGDFVFREVQYGNVRILFGAAPKGARVSRPEIHRDDYEVCWVLSGRLAVTLPHERHQLKPGEAIQFDAVLHHTYEALESCQVIVLHLRKGKRF